MCGYDYLSGKLDKRAYTRCPLRVSDPQTNFVAAK